MTHSPTLLLYPSMNLHNLYYRDLFQSDEPMRVQYDKYYELHRVKHLRKSTTRKVFTQRIQQYWRSVGEAIQKPSTGKVWKRLWWKYKQERESREWEKAIRKTYIARRKRWLSVEESFLNVSLKKRGKRHTSPEPKCKLNTYYTRVSRGYTHEQAISPVLMRQTVTK